MQNFAWAVCSNGTNFPAGGFTPAVATNWSPHTFTGTLGSVWVPDISINEHNNIKEPVTSGGHNWAFDQGSTTCKETDVGGASGPPTAWAIPPVNATDCFTLPVVKVQTITIQTNTQTGQISTSVSTGTSCSGIPGTTTSGNIVKTITCSEVFSNFGDLPQRSTALTPTCTPTNLSTATVANPNNTYLNQLGCSLVQLATGRVQATTAQTATTYVFTAGIKSGLFAVNLDNVTPPTAGGEAGKVVDGLGFYASIPGGQKLDSATISPDGRFLFGGSSKTNDAVWVCVNPLGDPGDPTKPLPPVQNFSVSANAASVPCMVVGQTGDTRILGIAIGFDGVNYQPYMAGFTSVSNFTTFPACVTAAFANRSPACGKASSTTPVSGAINAVVGKAETQGFVGHGQYLYRGIKGGAVYQAKVTPTGATVRQFAGKLSAPTGIGFDEGTLPTGLTSPTPFPSIVLYDDQSLLGLAAREALYKLPICEDLP